MVVGLVADAWSIERIQFSICSCVIFFEASGLGSLGAAVIYQILRYCQSWRHGALFADQIVLYRVAGICRLEIYCGFGTGTRMYSSSP